GEDRGARIRELRAAGGADDGRTVDREVDRLGATHVGAPPGRGAQAHGREAGRRGFDALLGAPRVPQAGQRGGREGAGGGGRGGSAAGDHPRLGGRLVEAGLGRPRSRGRLPHIIGGRIPILVAHQGDGAAGRVALQVVGTGGHDVAEELVP